MSKTYESEAMAAIHEMMADLHDVGAIDKQTMRHFDEACLAPIKPFKPEEIKSIREKEHVSQIVFANYPNVTGRLIGKWERAEKRPSGTSLKLLSPVEKKGLAAVTKPLRTRGRGSEANRARRRSSPAPLMRIPVAAPRRLHTGLKTRRVHLGQTFQRAGPFTPANQCRELLHVRKRLADGVKAAV